MKSSSRTSRAQSESQERSDMPSLRDTLALFEQTLANQEHWSEQLAEAHAVSVKTVAEKAATHAAELEKILTGKKAPPLIQTDFKSCNAMKSSSRTSRAQSESQERSGMSSLRDTLDLFEQTLANQEYWSEQLAEAHAVSVKAVAEKAATHAAELEKILTGKEAPPLIQTDFKSYGKDSTDSDQSRNGKVGKVHHDHFRGLTDHPKSDGGSKAHIHGDMGSLDRSRSRSMDRRISGHHCRARSRSPNKIGPYYCSDRSRSRDNTSKHSCSDRSRSSERTGSHWHGNRNGYCDKRILGHNSDRTRSRDRSSDHRNRSRSRSRSRTNTSNHCCSDRNRSHEGTCSCWHGDRNGYYDKRSLHHDSDRTGSRDRSLYHRSRSRDRFSRQETSRSKSPYPQ